MFSQMKNSKLKGYRPHQKIHFYIKKHFYRPRQNVGISYKSEFTSNNCIYIKIQLMLGYHEYIFWFSIFCLVSCCIFLSACQVQTPMLIISFMQNFLLYFIEIMDSVSQILLLVTTMISIVISTCTIDQRKICVLVLFYRKLSAYN